MNPAYTYNNPFMYTTPQTNSLYNQIPIQPVTGYPTPPAYGIHLNQKSLTDGILSLRTSIIRPNISIKS